MTTRTPPKAVALDVPAVVTTKSSRRPVPGSAAAEAVSQSPRLHDEAAQPSIARSAVTTPPPPIRKSAIVTTKRSKRIIAAPDDASEASPSVKAFFARVIRPRGELRGLDPAQKKPAPGRLGHGSVSQCWRVLVEGTQQTP